MSEVDKYAKVIWDYMLMHQELRPADVIIMSCSYNAKVAEWTAELYRRGLAPIVVFSGDVGRGTREYLQQSEARTFAAIAEAAGVPPSAIILEEASTNTGDNLVFSAKLLKQKGINPERVILVQKPYMERRLLASAHAQWPEPQPEFIVTSPPIGYKDYFDGTIAKDRSITTMVSDLDRIIKYPARGLQTEQEIPSEVRAAYDWLIVNGYDKGLVT